MPKKALYHPEHAEIAFPLLTSGPAGRKDRFLRFSVNVVFAEKENFNNDLLYFKELGSSFTITKVTGLALSELRVVIETTSAPCKGGIIIFFAESLFHLLLKRFFFLAIRFPSVLFATVAVQI